MTTQSTTIDPSCTDDLPLGTLVNVAFDGRGLARITGHEDDGIHIITFLDDPQRTSEHVTAGESAGCTRADMTVVQPAAPAASDVEEEGTTALTVVVAADVTLTVTGRPGHWTVWSTDSAGELVFAGKSDREKAHSAAIDVHDTVVDERIRVAGLQDLARADREAAAALAARMQTTQGLWDALRATTVPARTRTRGKRGGRGRRRGANAGSAPATTTTSVTKASPTTTAAPAKSAGKRRGRRGARKPAGQAAAATAAAQKTASPAPARRSTRRPRRTRPETVAAEASATTATATAGAVAAVTAPAVPSATATMAVTAAVAPAPAPTTTSGPTVTRAPAVPDARVDDGGDDEVADTQWAVYTQVDVLGGMSANVVGRVGALGDALSETLREVLGDREAGRVRKMMRAGGLITGPTVIQEPAPRALRIACAPLRSTEARTLSALARGELSMGVKACVDVKTAGTKARPLTSR